MTESTMTYIGSPVMSNGLIQIVLLFPFGTFTFPPYPGEEPKESDIKKTTTYKIVKENEVAYAKLAI